MEKTYEVKFMFKDNRDAAIYSDRLDFETEEKARDFISKIMNNEEIIKIYYIYLTTTERVI